MSTETAPPDRYTIAVRELCAFAAKAGDLDLRFTPAPSAQEGIAGHQTVVARRGADYQAELPLSGHHGNLQVRGRADGYDPVAYRLEEIKTHKGDLSAMPANHRALHWAQARVYGWLLCRQQALDRLTVALVYLDIGSQQETVLAEDCSAEVLRRHFEALCDRFLAWAARELAHRRARNSGLAELPFAHADMRPGQRQLAENVYRAARLGRCLMAQAPTGIGKTLGTLYPMLKAMPGTGLDKVFYLSAKGSGRALALDSLATLRRRAPAQALRVLELVARDTACLYPDRACHGDSCPLARGFYDRLPDARAAAVAQAAAGAGLLDAGALRQLALDHQVCPYYLSQELVRWADVVVGDYNYAYDVSALLHGLLLANGWQAAVLVDEAHNLPERARGMYSAALDQAAVQVLQRSAPAVLRPALRRLGRAWSALNRQHTQAYQVLDTAWPTAWLDALQGVVQAVSDHLAEQQAPGQPRPPAAPATAPATAPDPALMAWYFDALLFTRLAEGFDSRHSLLDLQVQPDPRGRPVSQLTLRNLVPAPFLAPRFALARSTVLFSATLAPPDYYLRMLGLPADTAWLDVAAPFAAEQLAVRIVPGVSTRWHARGRSLAPIADLMAQQFAAEPGIYLAFFSSFDYLAQVADTLAQRHPQIAHWRQQRGMDEAARRAFLDRCTPEAQGIGFAVLGGVFGEGIDLPGRRLIGAFIATLGLPQFNPVNEQMRQRLDAAHGTGYADTYLYPGLRKVVQAAGRVIRTPTDHGCVLLIDDRYADPAVRALLPSWWSVQVQVQVQV
jgi:DNA excision repair protein ERCC-2